LWSPETSSSCEEQARGAAVERRVPVHVPLSAIFKSGASAQPRRSVLCTVVARDGE
jgi:hypothetical protein